MATYRFVKVAFPANDLWDVAYRNGICVGRLRASYNEKVFYLMDENLWTRLKADSLEELAKKIEQSEFWRSDYDYWNGAYHYYFNTKTGYDHLAYAEEFYPVVKEVIIEL
jgi:hypothetical protein